MKHIKYFLILLALIIVAVIALNYINSKPKKAKQNPFEYNVDDFRKVDPELIHYTELRQIRVKLEGKAGIAGHNGNMYLAANNHVSVITTGGRMIDQFNVKTDTRAIAVNDEFIAVAYGNIFEVYTHEGELQFATQPVSENSNFTSIAFWNHEIVVADAGTRKLYIFDKSEMLDEITGISGTTTSHGFIVPSARFDVAVNADNELWVVNPGIHSLQQYTRRGSLSTSWRKASLNIEGFSGCCNPAQIAKLPDGNIITSEKNMPRIKVYSPNGELLSVVAPPELFGNNVEAAEVAALGETIVALDTEQQLIRIFEKKE